MKTTIDLRAGQRASIRGHRCPYCFCPGTMKLRRIENYEMAGVMVPVAHVNVCESCNGHLVTENEWAEHQR